CHPAHRRLHAGLPGVQQWLRLGAWRHHPGGGGLSRAHALPALVPPGGRPVRGAQGRRMLRVAVVGVILAVLLFPIYWLILTSPNAPDRILPRDPPSLLPRRPWLEAYRHVLGDSHFVVFARNSLIVAGSVTLFGVSVSALGAYALARLVFPGRRLVGRLVLFAYVGPPA